MLKFLKILLTAGLTIASFARADETTGFLWECRVDTVLRGAPSYFMMYGNDSWEGRANLRCHSGIAEAQLPVQIVFNSLMQGMGANAADLLAINITLFTSRLPPFHVQSVVSNRSDQSLMWEFETASLKVTVEPSAEGGLELRPGLQDSLKSGTFFIRADSSFIK